MKYEVTVFKPSGKWYSDEDVEINESLPYFEKCQKVADFLKQYSGSAEGWIGHVVMDDLERIIFSDIQYAEV